MKALSIAVLSAAVLLGATASASALAHGGHRHGGHHRHHGVRLGVFIGAPVVFAPWYYHPPAYYYPPAAVVPSSPPVYIERGNAQPEPSQQAYWYYCPEASGYYPYVRNCPGGWQRVAPQPPPS